MRLCGRLFMVVLQIVYGCVTGFVWRYCRLCGVVLQVLCDSDARCVIWCYRFCVTQS